MTRGMTPCLLAWLLFPCLALSKEDPTSLPKPDVDGAMPLEQALAKRRSVRGFSSKELSPAQVSQLLWACQGVTSLLRRRTAPSAGALYPLVALLADKTGVYRYAPNGHSLERVGARDIRAELAAAALGQDSVREAPVSIVLAGDPSRLERKYARRSERYALIEAGHAAQNVLLQAVALGLGAVPIGAFRDSAVSKLLGLPEGLAPYVIIPVGYAS